MLNFQPILKPIHEEELQDFIALDSKIMYQEAIIPGNQAPPPLTLVQAKAALTDGDILDWVYDEQKQIAGYYWLQKKPDHLFIAGIAILKKYYGSGLSAYLLQAAEILAQNLHYARCKITVAPLNGRAISSYFKQGYHVVECVPAYFGEAHPSAFRFIMEKALNNHTQKINLDENQSLKIQSGDQVGLLNASEQGFVGVKLIQSASGDNQKNMIVFVPA